jgi:hypothetical protein
LATTLKLIDLGLESFREEFRDLSDTWRNLDTKAQGVGAIAGVFLAALFSWIREPFSNFSQFDKLAILVSILLLITAVVAGLLTLLIRKVAAPPLGEETAKMLKDIIGKYKDEEASARIAAFYNDQVGIWKEANIGFKKGVNIKAFRLSISQVALTLAAVFVGSTAVRYIVVRF